MTSGFTFDMKRFALHDGPGLRTTVFLKGCPLSCLGCHNPEGQGVGKELVFRADRCTSCGDCIPACPSRAISILDREQEDPGPGGRILVSRDRCRLTGACTQVCLPGALEMVGTPRTAREILDLVERDRVFFDESGGGVTFSGGEPFSQPDFLRALLLGAKAREISVVLDTCGHAEPALFRELAPLADHLLFDLKVLDESRHQEYTGVHNRWILENLRWAGRAPGPARHPGLTVRVPLIPGVNDDPANLAATARFLTGLERIPPVDLLPYHRLGVGKYDQTGRTYRLPEVTPPARAHVARAVRIMEEHSIQVSVRGERHGHD